MTTLAEEFQTTYQAVRTRAAHRILGNVGTFDTSEFSARALFYGGVAAAFRLLEERYQAKNPDDLDAEEAVRELLVAMAEVSSEVVSEMGMQAAMVMQLAQDKLDQVRSRSEQSGGSSHG